jgi:hypothetical protein
VTPDANNALTIALHRDGPQAIPALGTEVLEVEVDVQVADALGVTTTATACVNYNPLAAPLDIQPMSPATAFTESLFQMSFASASPVSDVLERNPTSPAVFGETFVQYTAEPITLAVTFTPPTAQYEKTIASVYVESTSGSLACGSSESPSTDQRCSTFTDVTGSTSSASGAVASGIWSAALFDDAIGSQAAACSITGLSATCTIPPRQADELSHSYTLFTFLDDVTDLNPAASGPFSEYIVAGRNYTGLPPTTISHCNVRTSTFDKGTAYYTCSSTTYAHVVALAEAELDFAPTSVLFSTSVGVDVPVAPVSNVPSPMTSATMTWSSGADVLPGS